MSKRSRREKRRNAKAGKHPPAGPPRPERGPTGGDVAREVAEGVVGLAFDWLVGPRRR